MRHRPNQRGFTIIEVLMFLAISGFVFVAAITQYSAQQKSVNFSQGVRDLQAVISSVSNETASSYAPDLSSYHCTAPPVVVTAAVPPQDNSGCIFLGKAFGAGLTDTCTAALIEDCRDQITIPIIGARTDSSGGLVSSYSTALPYALSASSFTTSGVLNNGVGIYRTFVRNPDGSNKRTIAGVAFLFDLNSASHLGNKVDLLGLPAGAASGGANKLVTAINKLKAGIPDTDYYLNPADGITFCVKDGNDKLSAISLGSGGSSLDVQVENTSSLDSGC